jgi:lysine 2,3-aminomutase
MAGLINGEFREKISDYLYNLMDQVKVEQGENSKAYKALYNQYVRTEAETAAQKEKNKKHYEACLKETDELPRGIERLYRRQLVIDLTMVCAAHCRYCLRANYEIMQITKKDIAKIVRYLAKDLELKEILVTGGDPFLVPQLLKHLISEIVKKATNIRIIRIGTRLPVQDPQKFDEEMLGFFRAYQDAVQFEVAIQINHPIELQPEPRHIIFSLQKAGVRVYSQNVLLKNVNDDTDTLIELYDNLRYLGVEAHYLFHPIPMQGTAHLRVTLKRSLQLIKELTSSGMISGRIKPMLSLMTDVGKVTLYEGTIGQKDDSGYYTIKTCYKLKDRLRWNPDYQLPASAFIDKDGYINVKYLEDGRD